MNNVSLSAREAALLTLIRCERDGSYSNIESNTQIKKHSLEGNERALFTALVRGVIERKITLDYYISRVSTRPIEDLDPVLLMILRIGVYQIFFFDRIPDHAAVNESVDLVKKHTGKNTASYANAVLRELLRKNKNAALTLPKDELTALSVKYSIPKDLITMWQKQYGREQTETILDALSKPHGTTLHVNTLKTSVESLCSTLDSLDIKYSTGSDTEAIFIHSGTPFEKIEKLAQNGLFFVQDASSQKAAAMLGALPNETVIDTCICPGGKSFALALSMKNKGHIFGYDLHKNKFSLVRDTQSRLGIEIISLEERDARTPNKSLFGKADRVLCDVPCSGLGIIAKKPEIRYRDLCNLERFSSLSIEILNASKNYCKTGGHLLFSTCTLNKTENDDVLDRFLAENLNFSLIEKNTIFPNEHSDGFFAALLKCNKQE